MNDNDCARCGHGRSYHYREAGKAFVPRNPKTCRLCGCEKWVGGRCWICGGWCYSAFVTRLCRTCFNRMHYEKREELRNDPRL